MDGFTDETSAAELAGIVGQLLMEKYADAIDSPAARDGPQSRPHSPRQRRAATAAERSSPDPHSAADDPAFAATTDVTPEHYDLKPVPRIPRAGTAALGQFSRLGIENPYFDVHEGGHLRHDGDRRPPDDQLSSYNYLGMSGRSRR